MIKYLQKIMLLMFILINHIVMWNRLRLINAEQRTNYNSIYYMPKTFFFGTHSDNLITKHALWVYEVTREKMMKYS